MIFLLFMFFSTLCSILCVSSITNAELIDSLPGQPEKVSFKQYSGYIVTDDYYGRALFYYFVEAQSKNALTLPLTLWLGGGHGCSTVGDSLFMEHGPFRVGKDGNLKKNEFSWNSESNMLYVDSPVGVGFSYSNTSSDYSNKWNDIMSANENMKFLLKWFEKFPNYKNLNFYLAGDSYAGHLVPQLATLVLEYNRKPHVQPIKLKGIALGNPILQDPNTDLAEYLWYHGIISVESRIMQKTLCSLRRYRHELHHGNLSKSCAKMGNTMNEELGTDLDMDNLLWPICISSNSGPQQIASETTFDDHCNLPERTVAYLNKPEVQKAIHANTTRLPYSYDTDCHGPFNSTLDDYENNMIPTLSALLKRHIPILLYSGDQDATVPVTETRSIANMLAKDLKLVTLQKNRPWYSGFQIGGWSETFGKFRSGKNVTYLTFASVKGGGRSIPLTFPSEALILFKAFLRKAFLRRSPPPITS